MVSVSILVVIVISWTTQARSKVDAGYGAGYIAARMWLQNRNDVVNDPCHLFTGDAVRCRQNDCNYDCGNGHCSKDKTGCAVASGCADNCYDICSCRRRGCQFNVANHQCRNYTSLECRPNQFSPRECGRKDARYSFGGEICWQKEERGDCSVDDVILAVNLQGDSHTDVNGIMYQAFLDVPYQDPHKLLANASARNYMGRPDEDRPLYTTILSANPKGHKGLQCIAYDVPICKDGNYELSLKLLESHWDEIGKRHFTVRFANHLVFPEIDIIALAGRRYMAIDLNINFHVYNGELTLRGFPPAAITDGKDIDLEFCIGECKNSYVRKFFVGAFSVIKLKQGISSEDSGLDYCNST